MIHQSDPNFIVSFYNVRLHYKSIPTASFSLEDIHSPFGGAHGRDESSKDHSIVVYALDFFDNNINLIDIGILGLDGRR